MFRSASLLRQQASYTAVEETLTSINSAWLCRHRNLSSASQSGHQVTSSLVTIPRQHGATTPCSTRSLLGLAVQRVLQPCLRRYSSYPPHQILSMPALSPTMEQGNLIAWKVRQGDEVEAGTELADIETDKATLGFETLDEGFIAKLLVADGTNDIPVGVPVVVIVENKEDVAAFADFQPGASSAASPPASSAAPADAPVAATVPRSSKMGPAARMALENAKLTADQVQPTGPKGIVTKADVLAAIAGGTTPAATPAAPVAAKAAPAATPAAKAAAPAGGVPGEPNSFGRVQRGERYTDIPTSNMRRVIAKRLLQSKVETPAIYVTGSARLGPLSSLRAALKQTGMKVSVNDFVIKAVAKALQAVPGACAGWDAKAEEIKRFSSIDVSVAVATEGGLITPIVKGADEKSVIEIGKDMKDLAGRARENKLKPEEFTGGSFTISNLGMFGVKEFSAIINPPQACILAVGGSVERCAEDSGHLVSDPYMNVKLSADNRVVDEGTAAQFLESFQFHMENPALLMA